MKVQSTPGTPALALAMAALAAQPFPARAASHREAPITTFDEKADITDWYAFQAACEDFSTCLFGNDSSRTTQPISVLNGP